MPTVSLTIDGRQVTVEKGKTVLQAAIENDIQVPYYCYHPGISIDGSCRVCIVKIEKMPKLQTSCSTPCADGMVVSTRTDEVTAARAGVFEFLLINHPLDCPVCDKGGECPLQDFSYAFGPDRSRTEFPRRVFDGEGVKGDVDFGPTLMLNRQRCILCTRCVRFMRDVEGDAQINIIDRGYGSEIATFQEEGVHSLMSGNLVDICPVGAITARDYRFASRPWDNPDVADTICTDCARGCNTTAWLKAKPEWAKGSRLVRLTPRFNADVNGYWMCDIGRYGYHWIESDRRIRRPLVKSPNGGPDGTQQPTAWHDLTSGLQAALGGVVRSDAGRVRFLLSAHASVEELFVFRRLAEELGASASGGQSGAGAITVGWRTSRKTQPPDTTFVIPEVDAPNVNGARLLGLAPGQNGEPQGPADVSSLRAAVERGDVAALYVFDPGPEGTLGDVQWILDARARGLLPQLIVQGTCLTDLARAADFVLPGASSLEKEASYINERGQLQGTARVLAPPGEAREDWRVAVGVAEALGLPMHYAGPAQLRADIVARFGATLQFSKPGPAQTWLQASNPSERWKWDAMYQDLPPVKGAVDSLSLPPSPPSLIRLREVK